MRELVQVPKRQRAYLGVYKQQFDPWSHLTGASRVVARILDRLDRLGAWHAPVSKRRLERAMTANRVDGWEDAWRIVTGLREPQAVEITMGKRRQVFIRLLNVPPKYQAQSPPRHKRHGRHRRHSRGWSKGFIEMLKNHDRQLPFAYESDEGMDREVLPTPVPGDPLFSRRP